MSKILISIFFYQNLWGQNKLGYGFASIKFDENTVINFYDSQNSTYPDKKVEFFMDDDINSISIKNKKSIEEWLVPKAFWLDYNIFKLRAISVNDEWVEVITNEPNWESMWLKRDENVDYKNWEQYLTGLFNIERKDTISQFLYTSPNSNNIVKYEGADCFKVLKIEGDWIEITSPEYCDSFTYWQMKIESAWIRWRDKERLLIDCFEVP